MLNFGYIHQFAIYMILEDIYTVSPAFTTKHFIGDSNHYFLFSTKNTPGCHPVGGTRYHQMIGPSMRRGLVSHRILLVPSVDDPEHDPLEVGGS